MTEIQKYQQPTREALQVANRGCHIQGIEQQEAASIEVYGNYMTIDNGAAGYSIAVLSSEDAHRLQAKPPEQPYSYWTKTTMGELTGITGVLVYGLADMASRSAAEGAPLQEMLLGMGAVAAGGIGAAAHRIRRVRQYRRSIAHACQAANQNFIPNIPAVLPELAPETPVPYGGDREVKYGELWSTASVLQQRISSPTSRAEVPNRQLHAANMMRGMLANFWTDADRAEFLGTVMEPWTDLKSNLERLRVYEGSVDASPNFKKAYEPQVVRTAGNVAGILAGFLDTRGMELHGPASQQHAQADTQHTIAADREIIDLLTAQGEISRDRADVVISVDAAYRRG